MTTTLIILGCIILYFVVGYLPTKFIVWLFSRYDDLSDDPGAAGIISFMWLVWVIAVPAFIVIISCVYLWNKFSITGIIKYLFLGERTKKPSKEDYL